MILESKSHFAIPPGETIKEQLEDRGMSQKEFSARMDMSEKHISKLINGEVQLTGETAMKLEMVLGVPAQFWNRLEAIYREDIIRVNMENEMDADIEVARQFPYSDMAKYGWVPKSREAKEKVVQLRKFFEVVSLSLLDNQMIINIACRRLRITEKSDLALMAWAQKAKLEAREISVEPVNIKHLLAIIPAIRKMTLLDPSEFCVQLKEQLAECGIALVFLPHLKGSFLQGATFIDGKKIVVGLTTRGRDADKFWFSFFHEIAHIVLGHVGQLNGTSDEDEKAADQWARKMLISDDDFNEFVKKNDFSRLSILEFANEEGITPSIVVGRLQTEGFIKFNALNDLKKKYVFES